jgi:hypothetical protein
MNFVTLWRCGFWISGIAATFYLLTWIAMAWKPKRVLLGGVESLWLRCLVRSVYAGLLIVLLGAIDVIVNDFLFWRP